jgi:hypothetical protein
MFMSATFPGPHGRKSIQVGRTRPISALCRSSKRPSDRDSGRFCVQCSPRYVPTTCVVGSLREIPTRQYQAAARKRPCKGNVLVGTQTTAFTAFLRARPWSRSGRQRRPPTGGQNDAATVVPLRETDDSRRMPGAPVRSPDPPRVAFDLCGDIGQLPDADTGPAEGRPGAPVRCRHGDRPSRAQRKGQPLPMGGLQEPDPLGGAPHPHLAAGGSTGGCRYQTSRSRRPIRSTSSGASTKISEVIPRNISTLGARQVGGRSDADDRTTRDVERSSSIGVQQPRA